MKRLQKLVKAQLAWLYFKEIGEPIYEDTQKGREEARKNFDRHISLNKEALKKAFERYKEELQAEYLLVENGAFSRKKATEKSKKYFVVSKKNN